jgi:hypothetical protein
VCEHTFVLLKFVLTEYDPERPWIVVGERQETVELATMASFHAWANEAWPAPRWRAELHPGQG